jgi:hypothetical protein
MTRIAGVTIERNAYGTPRYVRIDLNRYGNQLADFFSANNIEVEKSPYNKKFVEMIREQEKLPGVKINIEDIWK